MVGTGSQSGSLVPRSKYLLVIAIATFSVGLIQVTHLVELPFAAWFSGTAGSLLPTSSLLDFMRSVGYLSLFVLMALESASLPIPSEVVLPIAGYLVSLGVMDFWVAVAVSTAASLTGALVDYYLASKLGRLFVLRLLRALRVNERALDRAEGWFEKSGQWTVFAARFVPVLRTVISLPAGLFRMRLRPFVLMTTAGCAAWSAVLIYAGYLAGPAWDRAFTSSSAGIDVLFGVAVVVSAGYIIYYILQRRGKSAVETSLPSSVS